MKCTKKTTKKDIDSGKKYIDPPSGHKYGFPKIIPNDVSDVRQWLIDNGYPEKDVDFAMKWCRMWIENK